MNHARTPTLVYPDFDEVSPHTCTNQARRLELRAAAPLRKLRTPAVPPELSTVSTMRWEHPSPQRMRQSLYRDSAQRPFYVPKAQDDDEHVEAWVDVQASLLQNAANRLAVPAPRIPDDDEVAAAPPRGNQYAATAGDVRCAAPVRVAFASPTASPLCLAPRSVCTSSRLTSEAPSHQRDAEASPNRKSGAESFGWAAEPNAKTTPGNWGHISVYLAAGVAAAQEGQRSRRAEEFVLASTRPAEIALPPIDGSAMERPQCAARPVQERGTTSAPCAEHGALLFTDSDSDVVPHAALQPLHEKVYTADAGLFVRTPCARRFDAEVPPLAAGGEFRHLLDLFGRPRTGNNAASDGVPLLLDDALEVRPV